MRNVNYEYLDENTKSLLNNLAEEYKELLLRQIIERNNYKSVEVVSVREIIDLDNSIKQNMIKTSIQNRKMLLKKLFTFTGMAYGVIGLIVFFYFNYKEQINLNAINKPQNMGLLIAMFGFSFAILSYIMKDFRSIYLFKNVQHPDMESDKFDYYEIIEKWNEIERLAYKKVNLGAGDNQYVPLHKVLDDLRNSGILSDEDSIKLRNVLSTRNKVVHYSGERLSNDKLIESLNYANDIIEKFARE